MKKDPRTTVKHMLSFIPAKEIGFKKELVSLLQESVYRPDHLNYLTWMDLDRIINKRLFTNLKQPWFLCVLGEFRCTTSKFILAEYNQVFKKG